MFVQRLRVFPEPARSYDDSHGGGSKERVGQPLSEPPKGRALLDWIDAH